MMMARGNCPFVLLVLASLVGCPEVNLAPDADAGALAQPAKPIPPVNCGPPCAGKVVQVRTGNDHTCARYDTGGVVCWGVVRGVPSELSVLFSEDHNGVNEPAPLAAVQGIDDAIDLAVGDAHSCVVRADHTLWCWGSNFWGQLGQSDSRGEFHTPVPVLDIRAREPRPTHPQPLRVAFVRASRRSTYGALADSFGFVLVEELYRHDFKAIARASTGDDGCDVLQDGTVYCSGSNKWGAFGNGRRDTPGKQPPYDRTLPKEEVADAVDIVAGDAHMCALLKSGKVKCWGRNVGGQMGLGKGDNETHTPAEVPGLDDVVRLDANDNVTCAVRRGGQLVCWGMNRSDLFLLDTSFADQLEQTHIVRAGDVVDVTLHADHGCVLRRSGEVACWGMNNYGQVYPAGHEGGRRPGDFVTIRLP